MVSTDGARGGSPPRRVRLTDQALVAVRLARSGREDAGRVTVAALLVGLAAEQDGVAGRLLRAEPTNVSRLVERSPTAPPALAALDEAVRRADDAAAPRPPGTADLLAAAIERGGEDVTDLLAASGYDPRSLYRAAVRAAGQADETVGLPAGTAGSADLEVDAALAVARVRALPGGAVDLLRALSVVTTDRPAPQEDLDAALERLRVRGAPERAGPAWDAGLDAVLAAARAWCGPDAVLAADDLIRAAVVSGGRGPGVLLAELAAVGGEAPR